MKFKLHLSVEIFYLNKNYNEQFAEDNIKLKFGCKFTRNFLIFDASHATALMTVPLLFSVYFFIALNHDSVKKMSPN